MKFIKFEIKNFKNLSQVVFDWDEILFLIGENNCGKSSVLGALDCFLSGKAIKDKDLFRNGVCDELNAIELIGHFTELTDQEKANPAVRGHLFGSNWILKKRFWLETDGTTENWKEQYSSYQQIETFVGWPETGRAWTAWPAEYTAAITEVQTAGYARVNDESRTFLKERIRALRPDLITTQDGWSANPGGGGNWKSNANSILPEFIYVRAVQDVNEETQSK